MSKIEKELQEATEIEAKKGEDRADYLARMMKAVAGLSEKGWDALSPEAQEWYNNNAEGRNTAKKAGKSFDLVDFQAEEEEKPARRRNSEDEEKPAAKSAEKPSLDKLEDGQRVKITTKRGKEITGEVVENSKRKEFVVVKDGEGAEHEIDYDKVETLEIFHGTAGQDSGGDAEPAAGDKVEITTKRGKVIKATIVELTDDEIVFDDGDGKDDLARDRVESIKVIEKGAKEAGKKGAKEADPENKPRGAKASAKEEKDEAADAKRTRTTNADGVSIGQVVKELIADNLDATEAEIMAMAKKMKVEFKENTLHLNYVECHKFLTVLKEKKLLKK